MKVGGMMSEPNIFFSNPIDSFSFASSVFDKTDEQTNSEVDKLFGWFDETITLIRQNNDGFADSSQESIGAQYRKASTRLSSPAHPTAQKNVIPPTQPMSKKQPAQPVEQKKSKQPTEPKQSTTSRVQNDPINNQRDTKITESIFEAAEKPEQNISRQVEKIDAYMAHYIERLDDMLSSQALKYEKIMSTEQASLREAVVGINAINITNGKSMQHIESIATALASGVDTLKGILRQSSNDVKEQNQAMLTSMEGLFERFAERISASISTASDSINKLAKDFEDYIKRIDEFNLEQNKKTAELVTSFTSSISEQMAFAANSSDESMKTTFEMFETSVVKMVERFDEQSRDIGDSAREIKQEIKSLSTNLKKSTTVFNKGLNDSVNSTFKEIDGGLSDLTNRFANTLEAVQSSIEAIQNSIEAMQNSVEALPSVR